MTSPHRSFLIGAAAMAALVTAPALAQLEITEVMYNPLDDDVWEWIEVRNTSAADIDIDGYIAFNLGDGELASPTPTIFSSPNSPNTIVPAGGAAVIYDGFHGAGQPGTFDDAQFRSAWGLDASVPLMAGQFFPSLSNSEGSSGQSIGFWASLADYQADLVDDGTGSGDREVGSFSQTAFSVDYSDAAFPAVDGMSSITWTGQGDRTNGTTWVLSQANVAGAYASVEVTVAAPSNNPNEVANPGRVTTIGTAPADSLIITEIMYDAGGAEPDWEWVEVYNSAATPLDLAGWVIDDINGSAHSEANIAAGMVPADGTAILFNVDDTPQADFETAWGAGLNLIPVTDWGAMGLNNGGDTIGFWTDFASYSGDHETHANATLSLTYTDDPDFPDSNNLASITLLDLGADPTDGFSWDLSFIGDDVGSFNADAVGDSIVFHAGGDIGSPGTFELQDLVDPDLDDDGDVDGNDFLLIQRQNPELIEVWAQQYGTGVPAGVNGTAVPEPATVGLLAIGIGLLIQNRRRPKLSC